MPEPVEYALVLLVYALILPPLAVPLMMRVLSIETHR
jgi:cytochrome c oxidase subunit IV